LSVKLESVIRSDPEILGGTPVFVGTRVPVQSLFDHLEAGDSIDDFLEGFPSVRREQVIAVIALRARSNRLADTRPLMPRVLTVLSSVHAGTLTVVG
jgi:uncharacterized protein (DUF433 family)